MTGATLKMFDRIMQKLYANAYNVAQISWRNIASFNFIVNVMEDIILVKYRIEFLNFVI